MKFVSKGWSTLARHRPFCWLEPLGLLCMVGLIGLPGFFEMLFYRTADLRSMKAIRLSFLNRAWPTIFSMADMIWGKQKKAIVRQAEGVVVEVGPGLGHSLKYYDINKIKVIYGIEPNADFRPTLCEEIVKLGLQEKYQVLACGIEEIEKLKLAGIYQESVDTVLCVQVLCSVPEPRKVIRKLQELLKPGGQLLFFEHVSSKDTLSKWVQQFYQLIWSSIFDGCSLTRPTGFWLESLHGWKETYVTNPDTETGHEIMGHAMGRLVKT